MPDASEESIAISGQSRLDELLLICVEAKPERRQAVLEECCRQEAGLAGELRARLAMLEGIGFLDAPAPGTPPQLPDRFGDFKILSRLGGGGMGVVYLAEQESLERRVALKLIRPESLAFEGARERFRREGRLLSRLEHPGICPVYEVGEVEGTPYIAMRYLEGRPLDQIIVEARKKKQAGEQSSAARHRELMLLIEKAARAVHVAHEAGIVHRDLKPANIIVNVRGEPVLLDFGLAHDQTAASQLLTKTGDQLGTPAYMAPEQILGREATEQSDIYSLGVILYECLALSRPFESSSKQALDRRILSGDHQEVHRVDRSIARDLGIVIEKAMDLDVERRYSSALAFAEDLHRVCSLEPIHARPAGRLLRTRRWVQRNPVAAVLLASLLIGFTVTGVLLMRVEGALQQAKASALVRLAREASENDALGGLLIARKAWELERSVETLSEVCNQLAGSHEIARTEAHEGLVLRASWSDDGQYLVSCGDGGYVLLWDTLSGGEPEQLDLEDNVVDIDWSGKRFVAATLGMYTPEMPVGVAHVYSLETKAFNPTLRLEAAKGDSKYMLRARFSHDGKKVVIGTFGGAAWIWDLETKEKTELPGHDGTIWVASFSPDDQFVLTAVGYGRELRVMRGSSDFSARLWKTDGTPIRVLKGHTDSINAATISADSKHVLTGSRDGTIRLWDIATGSSQVFDAHADRVKSLAFHPDPSSRIFASGSRGPGIAKLWTFDGEELWSARHDGRVQRVAFTPDGRYLLTACSDKKSRLFDLHGRLLKTFRGHGNYVHDLAIAPGGSRAATTSKDHGVYLWRILDDEFAIFDDHKRAVMDIEFSPDKRHYVTASHDKTVRYWADGQSEVLTSGGRIDRARFSPSGKRIVVTDKDQRVRVLSVDGKELYSTVAQTEVFRGERMEAFRNCRAEFLSEDVVLLVGQGGVPKTWQLDGKAMPEVLPEWSSNKFFAHDYWDLALHPSRRCFAVACGTSALLIYNVDGKLMGGEARHGDLVRCVEFSHDGHLLVSASEDGTAILWSYRDESPHLKEMMVLPHESSVTMARFTPQGDRIVTAATDGSVHVWDLEGRELLALEVSTHEITSLAVFPDGERVLVGTENGLIHSWPISKQKILELSEIRTKNAQLSPALANRVQRILDGR